MSRAHEVGPQREQRAVSFPELVRLRFVWRTRATAAADGEDPTEEAGAYYSALADFERDNGRIVNAYWCSEIEAAVALTEKPRSRGPLKRFREPLRRFHRVSDFATRKEPAIARVLHQCDELAIRAVEVLGGHNQRICVQLVMASSGHLLSLVDRPPPSESEVRDAIVAEHDDFSGAQRYYRQAANGEAQLVYFLGMVLGLGLLGGLYFAIGRWLNIAGVNEAQIVGCLTAGAVGALVSVIARINTGSFALDFDVAPGYTLFPRRPAAVDRVDLRAHDLLRGHERLPRPVQGPRGPAKALLLPLRRRVPGGLQRALGAGHAHRRAGHAHGSHGERTARGGG